MVHPAGVSEVSRSLRLFHRRPTNLDEPRRALGAEMTATLVPARMLNEVVYCPRLFALEHLNREWADSADTIRGTTVHRRVDQASTATLPEEPAHVSPAQVRSLTLSDEALGVVARIDLVESRDGVVVPVDYKKGTVPDTSEGAWLPERVQVCAQGLLLRAHGYRCPEGALYFAGSRRRVAVPLTATLITSTLEAIERARKIIDAGALPEPLVDSPKCWGCALVGLCLPDEHNLLNDKTQRARPLAPPLEEGLPLYVEARGAKLCRQGGEIVVKIQDEVIERVRIADTSRVIVRGAASVTTPLLQSLAQRGVPLSVHGWSGRLTGTFLPVGGHNVLGRIAQHRAAADAGRSLELARRIVHGKIANQRVMLRRNGRGVPQHVLEQLQGWSRDSLESMSAQFLLGLEGTAARAYFQHFSCMLRDPALAQGFTLEGRNRRPPKDPLNALLSLAYAFLVREVTTILWGVGLDPWVGFLHHPRPGRPSLALDLMEEFRPILADSVVLRVINQGTIGASDFDARSVGVSLKDAARRRFIRAFEQRMSEEATHPRFSTSMSYRRIVEVQARLLCKSLLEEIEAYPPLKVR